MEAARMAGQLTSVVMGPLTPHRTFEFQSVDAPLLEAELGQLPVSPPALNSLPPIFTISMPMMRHDGASIGQLRALGFT